MLTRECHTRGMQQGAPVDIVMTKWGGRPHWVFPTTYLGCDEHGDWLGIPAGTHFSRPGAEYTSPVDQVTLVPAAGEDVDRAWLASFHAGPGAGFADVTGPVDVYVDIATPPEWSGSTVASVDLDLDVVRGVSGRVWIDDEDEFAEHRVRFGYPDDVVGLALRSCDQVQAAVSSRAAPYDGATARRWFAELASLAG